jgi:hypothetical protein
LLEELWNRLNKCYYNDKITYFLLKISKLYLAKNYTKVFFFILKALSTYNKKLMRKGKNPSKDILLQQANQIIGSLFLYIYRMKRAIIKMLFNFYLLFVFINKTSISQLKVSVISNGSCDTINTKLLQLQQEGIDELIIEKDLIGKINSILKVLRTAEERLITITDADVLFVNGWEQAVLNVFEAFPKAGSVSPVPVLELTFS